VFTSGKEAEAGHPRGCYYVISNCEFLCLLQ